MLKSKGKIIYYRRHYSSVPKNMEVNISQLDFQISINACHDEIMHKMQVLTNMEIQLLRKFQHQLTNSDMHFKMIHDIRVMILNLQEVYKDVKEYFDQMGIKFVYDFFRKIQVLMVCGYNFLSQAILVNHDKIEDKKSKDSSKSELLPCKVCKCTCSDGSKNKKRQIKEVEHYDYKISMLENEQQKITSQIQAIYEKIMTQKPMVERTKPSLATRELEDMKQNIENIIQSTNSVFEETYMMKYIEFKNYLTQIKKPQDIVDYFISNMNYNMKQKFLKAMQKAIYKAQNMDQKFEIKHSRDFQVQTDKIQKTNHQRQSIFKGYSSLKPQKNNALLTKERKYNQKMMTQIQYVRKQLNNLTSQNEKLKTQIQKKQTQKVQYQQNYQTLQQLYTKRSLQLQIVQNQNKWIKNEKQAQSKKFRNQINQLKKQQVQTSNKQIQIHIPPNYNHIATETQIAFFQNEVDNQIINVLKRSNEKMILNLSEKQRKIKELITIKEEYNYLKECKVICMQFLEDLREIITFKVNEISKGNIKPQESKKGREPIIPLNERTSNNSVMITIQKLSEEIKKIVFNNDTAKNRVIHQKRRSSVMKSTPLARSSRLQGRNSSKLSELNDSSNQIFFRNTSRRRSSQISIQRQTQVVRSIEVKKSAYQREYLQKIQKESSFDISSKDKIDLKNQPEIGMSKKSISSIQEESSMNNSFSQKIQTFSNDKRNSSFLQAKISEMTDSMRLRKNPIICKDQSVQTDLLSQKLEERAVLTHENFFSKQKSLQTDITCNILEEVQTEFISQKQQISKLKGELNIIKKNLQKQLNSTSRNPYIQKPLGRFTMNKIRSIERGRNSAIMKESFSINQTQFSQQIQEQMWQTTDMSLFAKKDQINDSSSSTPNIHKPIQMTLESRLQQLFNLKKNSALSASNLVIFKKPQRDYQKRSSQIIFEQLKFERQIKQKQKQIRNFSNNESLIINSQNENKWKESTDDFNLKTQNEKQNIQTRLKNQVFQKSIFVQKINQQDEKNHHSLSNRSTLIGVSKKTPIKRQRRFSPQDYQLPENVFERSVKHMLLTYGTKQKILNKIEQIYQQLEKQKESKKMKNILKASYTSRDFKRQITKKQMTQKFTLQNDIINQK